MKKKIIKLFVVTLFVVILFSGCSKQSKRGMATVLEQWQVTEENFKSVIKAIDDGSEAEVNLRVIEIDAKGYLKRYEFVGLKDGKEFLVYDEDGYIKD